MGCTWIKVPTLWARCRAWVYFEGRRAWFTGMLGGIWPVLTIFVYGFLLHRLLHSGLLNSRLVQDSGFRVLRLQRL